MTAGVVETTITLIGIISSIGGAVAILNKRISKLETGQSIISTDIKNFKTQLEKSEEIIKNVAISFDTNKKINHLISDSIKYLHDKEDVTVAALLQVNGESAKECIQWAIQTNLEGVEFQDFVVKYESLSMKLRDYLEEMHPKFVEVIKPRLTLLGRTYLNRVKVIIEDKTPNSRVHRFITATELSMQEIIVLLVKQWNLFKKINNNENVS